MGVTLSYIMLFLAFCICFFLEWIAVLKKHKTKCLWIALMILSGTGFIISAYADNIQVKERSRIASEMINEAFDENSNQYSAWFEEKFSEEERILNFSSWDQKNLDLENSVNLETASEMLKNIYMSYLTKTITVLDEDYLKIEDFRNDKGKWLGKYMDLTGECYLRTDASELFFTQEFTRSNPECKTAAYYYSYPDKKGKFIVWRPDTKWAPEELEDAKYPDGIYIGELTQNGEKFDVFVRNE